MGDKLSRIIKAETTSESTGLEQQASSVSK